MYLNILCLHLLLYSSFLSAGLRDYIRGSKQLRSPFKFPMLFFMQQTNVKTTICEVMNDNEATRDDVDYQIDLALEDHGTIELFQRPEQSTPSPDHVTSDCYLPCTE